MPIDLRNKLIMCQGGSNMDLYCDASLNLVQFTFDCNVYNIKYYEMFEAYYIITAENDVKYIIPRCLTLRLKK